MPFMFGVHIKNAKTLLAALPAVAVALVLIFNVAMPTWGNISDSNEDTHIGHFNEHDHNFVPKNHQDHPSHAHKHTHSDGTTHEHQYHDEHCAKINSNHIACLQISILVPMGIWSFVSSVGTSPNFVMSTHYSEILKPPILA